MLLKISKTKLFSAQIRSKLSFMGPRQRVTKFQVTVIYCFRLYPEKTTTFFGSGPNFPYLWGIGGNKSRKQHQIELKLWPQVVFIVVPMSFEAFLKNSNFYWDMTYPKFEFLVQVWPQFTPWKWPKSKIAIGLSKSIKIKALSSIFNENYNYLLYYLGFFQV